MYVACMLRGFNWLTVRISGIGEADWAFKTSFEVGDKELSAPNVELVFEGLDTFSIVTLVSRTSERATRDTVVVLTRETLFQNGQNILEWGACSLCLLSNSG